MIFTLIKQDITLFNLSYKGVFMKNNDDLKKILRLDNIEKVMKAIPLRWSMIKKEQGKGPKEALAELGIYVPESIQNSWCFFDFTQFLELDDFELQKIELVEIPNKTDRR